MADELKAREQLDQAEKATKRYQLFGNSRYEDAAELFKKAGNAFKVANNWQAAGNAFIRCADCHLKLQNKPDASTAYVSAANCFKKSSAQETIKCLKSAIELLNDMGRFNAIAKRHQQIGEVYEAESDFENAVEAYEQAANFFSGEGSTSSANACLLKVAEFSAQLEKYPKAISLYERIASDARRSQVLKNTTNDYYLRAGLLYLCQEDEVGAARALEKYQDQDATFGGCRECKLLQDILDCYREHDAERFTNVVYDYDNITKLGGWKTTALLRIKEHIKGSDLT